MFSRVARAYGSPTHFWLKVAGAVVALTAGYVVGKLELFMLAYTTLLTITTDLGTIVIQHAGDRDTNEVKAELKELARGVPGARDVIRDKE
jgi:low affinity Fe/Cu permease